MNQMVRPELFAPPTTAFQRVVMTPKQLDLVWDMNKDLNKREFDQFVETSIALGLSPLARQICAIVFSKNDQKKRQMAIVTTIMGLRAIADRTGTYRPDDKPARFTTDPNCVDKLANPHGIVDCIVTPYRYSHGEWFPVVGQVWWDEIAPIREYEGIRKLDSRTPWPGRPRGQCQKCAEATALRTGWPENLSNIYAEDEVDRARVLDLSPSDVADDFKKARLIESSQPKGTLLIDMWDGKGISAVSIDAFHDRVSAFIAEHAKDDAGGVLTWREQQRIAFQQFFAHDKAAALDLKKQFERIEAEEAANSSSTEAAGADGAEQ